MPGPEDDILLRGSANDFLGSSKAEFIHFNGMPSPLSGVELTLIETDEEPPVAPQET